MSASVVVQPRLTRTAPRSERRRNPHGGKDMGGLHLAGRAGGARRHRDALEIEGDHGGLGLHAFDRKKRRIRQPLGFGAENHRLGRDRAAVRLPAGRAAPACARPPPQAHRALRLRPPRTPRCRRHSRCRPACRAPGRRRGSADRRNGCPRWRRTSAPTPFGPPILCADSVIRSAPSAPISQGMRPTACTASTWSKPPAACTIAAASATGCTTPVSLLASISETSGRGALATASAERREIDTPVGVNGNVLDRIAGKPAAGAHRGMLDRRHQQLGRAGAFRRGLDRRRQRQHVGLGAARGEEHVAGRAADQRRDLVRAPVRPGAARRGLRHAPRTDCREPPAAPAAPGAPPRASGAVAFQSK